MDFDIINNPRQRVQTMSNVQYHTYYEKKPLKALKVSVSVVTLPLLKIVTRDLDGV